jgi:membrane protein DedA with SNARE-associated domain
MPAPRPAHAQETRDLQNLYSYFLWIPTLRAVLEAITDALTTLVGDHGLYAVFALMLVDAVFPAASELVMVYAGAVAAGAFAGQSVVLFGEAIDSESWAYVAMAISGTLGYLVGSILGWGIGLYGGRPLIERRGRFLHLTPENVDRAERWFERFGDWAVAISRVTPVIRSFISIPAGVVRMPLGRYTLLTIPGSAVWCFGLAGIGWALGSKWEEFHHAFRYAEYLVVAAIILLVVAVVVRHRRTSGAPSGDAA